MIDYTENPQKAIFSNKDNFIILEDRYGKIDKFYFNIAIEEIQKCLNLSSAINDVKFVVRRLFFNGKSSSFFCGVDCFYDKEKVTIEEGAIESTFDFDTEHYIIDGCRHEGEPFQLVLQFNFKLQTINRHSSSFDFFANNYYKNHESYISS